MSNILLFFMSSYTPTVENGAYNRAQTNEAVLYELQKKKESRTDMVLALCSDKVRKDPCVPTLDGPISGSTSCPPPTFGMIIFSPSLCLTA